MVTRTSPKPKEAREKGPLTLWTSNLKTEEGKREFLQLMQVSNGPVLKRLLSIVQEELNKSQKSSLNSKNYDSPSWAYIQADNVGYQRALSIMEELIKGIVK